MSEPSTTTTGGIPVEIKCPYRDCGHKWTIGAAVLASPAGYFSGSREPIPCPKCNRPCSLEPIFYDRPA